MYKWLLITLLIFTPSKAYADLDMLDAEGSLIIFIILTLLFVLMFFYDQVLKYGGKTSRKYLNISIVFLTGCLIILISKSIVLVGLDSLGATLSILFLVSIPSFLLSIIIAYIFKFWVKNKIINITNIAKIFLFSSLLLPLLFISYSILQSGGWVVYHEGPFKGKVIDAETKKPLAGSVVAVIYNVRDYNLFDFGSTVVDAREVLTDENGEFYISSYVYYHFYPFAIKEASEFIIFKSNYTAFPGSDYFYKYFPESPLGRIDNDTLLNFFKKGITIELLHLKTKEEIINNARNIDIRKISSRKLPVLHRMVDEDAKLYSRK